MKDINATVMVDLTKEKQEIFKNFKKSDKQGINRALRKGAKIEEARNDEEWEEFYEIYKETMKLGGTDVVSLNELRNNTAKLFLCKFDGKIIAGLGIHFIDEYNKEIPRLYFNASKKEYLYLQTNNLLYWHVICWCKEKGYEKFDLGGWQIKARGHLKGINSFKEKFGEIVYYYKDYGFFKATGRKLIRNFSIFWWLNKKIKGR